MSEPSIIYFYPKWIRKAVTFTIDDGNEILDPKFISYVKPAGIMGTFNLQGIQPWQTAEQLIEIYGDYGIANHVKNHPKLFKEEDKALLINEVWNDSMTDHEHYYLGELSGTYRFWLNKYHGTIAERDAFIRFVDEAQDELVSMFGKDKVKGFVWPWGDQRDEELQKAIESRFESMRATGDVGGSTNYAVPKNRMHWSYNAGVNYLEEETENFINFPDNNELQFFCFGIHAHDYENAQKWDLLEDTCRKLGYQPDKYYSATVDELFAYSDATEAVTLVDGKPVNNSNLDIWLKINGKKAILEKNSSRLKYYE